MKAGRELKVWGEGRACELVDGGLLRIVKCPCDGVGAGKIAGV
jgi:hypothetical protein